MALHYMKRERVRKASPLIAAALVAPSCSGLSKEASGWQQGWSSAQQDKWYSGTQGSRLMPLAWFRALEQPDGTVLFTAPGYLAQFRLLERPGGLPVGFAIDDNDDTDLTVSKLRWFDGQTQKEQWVGLNCSACHTAEISYKGTSLRVDGGPSLFDYQSFVEAVDQALKATLVSSAAGDGPAHARWDRFAPRVLGCPASNQNCERSDTPQNREMLRAALSRLTAWEDRVEKLNRTPLRYGYGRVDAFGHIFNKVSLFSGAANPTPNPANAPVSYPFLWDIYRHDKLQWNGIVDSVRIKLGVGYLDVGALGRNTGEVIGVFGDVAVRPDAGLSGYKSSIWVDNLDELENQLRTLKPPAWPVKLLGTPQAIVQGRELFRTHCAQCHETQPGTAPYKVHMAPQLRDSPENTDSWMACNALTYKSSPGNLNGTRINYFTGVERYTNAPAPIASMLTTTVKGALASKKLEIAKQAGRIFFDVVRGARVVIEEAPDLRPFLLDACFDANSPLFAYKARPLDGIWATAPYLHNGSVSSLYELLLAPEKRMASFMVGTREYDPNKVGYFTDPAAAGNTFRFDTALPGNSNQGHNYGAGAFNDRQRYQIIEYLKTL